MSHKLLKERPWLERYTGAPISVRVELIDEKFLAHSPASVSYNALNGTGRQWQEVLWVGTNGERVGRCSGRPSGLDHVHHQKEAPNYDGRTIGESLFDIKKIEEIKEAVETTRFHEGENFGITRAEVVIRKKPKRFKLHNWVTEKLANCRITIADMQKQLLKPKTSDEPQSFELINRFMINAAIDAIPAIRNDEYARHFSSFTLSQVSLEVLNMRLQPNYGPKATDICLLDKMGGLIERIQLWSGGQGNNRRLQLAEQFTTLGNLLADSNFQNVRAIGLDEIYDLEISDFDFFGRRRRNGYFTYYQLAEGESFANLVARSKK